MRVKLWLYLETQDRSFGGQVEKIVETSFTLTPDMLVEDFAWKNARPINAVYFSTDTPDELSVFMGREATESEAHFHQTVDMYKGHGWKSKVSGG